MIGETIGNHKITAKLGQGGMGTVYEAEDTTLGRKVAIKILNPSLTGGKELERFEAEAKVQASLNHPNVVTLYKFEPIDNSYYMVMEYVEGKTLSELVRSNGALPPHIVVTISKQVLDGLSAAHRRGIVHRDLKPSNIMITPEGVAKVMDFGIAKVQGGKSLTATGALVGTVYYMSPEQVRGEVVDARSDLYSFGIILFELLTGRVPFKDDSDFQIMIHHVQTPPPPPTSLLPQIPGDLEQIVMRCLAKDQNLRYQAADEILTALDAFEEQERAQGRGQLYTRKFLAQWLAEPKVAAPVSPRESATVLDSKAIPAAVTGTGAAAPAPQPVAPPPPPPSPAPVAYTTTPPVPTEFRKSLAQQGSPAPPKKGLLFIAALLGIVVLAAAGTWLYMKRPAKPAADLAATAPPPASEPVQATSAPAIPSQPADSGSAPATQSQPVDAASAPAAQAQDTAGTSAPAAPAAPAAPTASRPSLTTSAAQPPPARVESVPGKPAQPSRAAAQGTSRSNLANPRTVAAGVAPSSPAAAAQAPEPALPQGILIFIDGDQSGERLPLATAQSRVAEIVRQNGHQVVSSGAVAANVRSALDRRDFAEIRRNGVGYVIMGTAHGSLEQQNAYGNTFNVARASVSFELVRMSDGAVASTGSGDARSRGSANAVAALQEAVMTATSDAARALMRDFKP